MKNRLTIEDYLNVILFKMTYDVIDFKNTSNGF